MVGSRFRLAVAYGIVRFAIVGALILLFVAGMSFSLLLIMFLLLGIVDIWLQTTRFICAECGISMFRGKYDHLRPLPRRRCNVCGNDHETSAPSDG